jgi:formate/nitrite transporter FocA (FNT family)
MPVPLLHSRHQLDEEHHEEQAEARERTAPTGTVVYVAINQEGEDELSRTTSALAWSGLAAGLSMGFSFAVEGLLSAALPTAKWAPLVATLGYSVGFLIVVLGRQQLFTENTLTVMLPLLRLGRADLARNVARLWATVFGANVAGAFLFALAAGRTGAFPPDVHAALAHLAAQAMEPAPATMLLRGVYAGWLIALMVWLLPYADTARFWVIVLLSYIVGLGHFPHVIAGSVDVLYLVVTGGASVGAYLTRFLLPSLAGNIIGGVSLVAALAHVQYGDAQEAHGGLRS